MSMKRTCAISSRNLLFCPSSIGRHLRRQISLRHFCCLTVSKTIDISMGLHTDHIPPRPLLPAPCPLLLARERFLIHYIGHLARITTVVPFQHIDHCLHRTSSHPFVGI